MSQESNTGLDIFPAFSGQKSFSSLRHGFFFVFLCVVSAFKSRLPVMVTRGTKLSKDKRACSVQQTPTFVFLMCLPIKPCVRPPRASEIDTEECGASRVWQGYSVTLLAATRWEQQLFSLLVSLHLIVTHLVSESLSCAARTSLQLPIG